MLKSKIGKSLYLCNSFLIITASFAVDPVPGHKVIFPEDKNGLKTSLVTTCESKLGYNVVDRVILPTNSVSPGSSNQPQIALNRKGLAFVKKYIKNSSECLSVVRKRSSVPFNIIDSVFNRYGLPVELKYLAVIESELKPSALSQVGARGPWQLMPGTAQILGLKINRRTDERTDYYKSTIAAARYLKDLYALFDDWLLVLAAYNGGPKPVYTAIQKSGSKNFWILQDYLPSESQDHVKKFIATHYYFEGRGSVTTLTRAENIKYRKAVAAFAKSIYSPSISDASASNSNNAGKYFAINYEMVPQIGVEPYESNNHSSQNQVGIRKEESTEQKFRRLMKESAESLRRSAKII
ncbi:MAG: lytic transglycosylase domain-containing protein [Chitinophagales bacterium]